MRGPHFRGKPRSKRHFRTAEPRLVDHSGAKLGESVGRCVSLGHRTRCLGNVSLSIFGACVWATPRPSSGGMPWAKRQIRATELRFLENGSSKLACLGELGAILGGCPGRNDTFGPPNSDLLENVSITLAIVGHVGAILGGASMFAECLGQFCTRRRPL